MSCGCAGSRTRKGPRTPPTVTATATAYYGVTRDRPVAKRHRGPSSPLTPSPPPRGLPPTSVIWGPVLWESIHTLSLYDVSENVLKDDWGPLLDLLIAELPCGECATHLREWVAEHPFDGDAMWFVELHNAVNRRLGKPIWTAEEAGGKFGPNAHVDPDIILINRCTTVGELDSYMSEEISARLRQMFDRLLQA